MICNPPKTTLMTAININIEEFMQVLDSIRNSGTVFVNLDMVQDEDNPTMNKLVVHPVPSELAPKQNKEQAQEQELVLNIRDPKISSENDEIFDAFNDIM